MSKLIHIVKIEETKAQNLIDVEILGEHLCHFKTIVNFTEINKFGLAEVTEEDSRENNQRIWTTTIKYNTKNKKSSSERRMAYRLTTIDGTQFLVGTYDRPYTITKNSNPFPGKPTETTLRSVTITWKAPIGLMYIIP
ncbi:MAG: hypothetical protein LKE54_03610 [Prevotella sp.]|jgi:hypothetical protein|nr:hypothetical protein [Prevotella sp.]MCH3994133.1 hypothetical protein [Prevotella sp.]